MQTADVGQPEMTIQLADEIAAQQDIDDGTFRQLELQQKFDTQIKLQVITHKDKWLSPAFSAFIDALQAL